MLDALLETDKPFLTPQEVSAVLKCDPQTIRVTARQRPDLIGFEFTFVGNRMKIPRVPFLRFLGVYKEDQS
jgi:hypothetical protein